MSEVSKIETGLNAAAAIGAAAGGPIGAEVATCLQVGEAVLNSVLASQSDHATALATATAAASTLATAAQPVLATLPTATATKAKAGLDLLQMILADLKSVFGL